MLGCKGDGNDGVVPGKVWLRLVRILVVRSGVLSSANDVQEMSMVIGVGVVCDMFICLARAGWEVSGVRGLGLGFSNSGGTYGESGICVFVLVAVVCGGGLGKGLEGRVVLCQYVV